MSGGGRLTRVSAFLNSISLPWNREANSDAVLAESPGSRAFSSPKERELARVIKSKTELAITSPILEFTIQKSIQKSNLPSVFREVADAARSSLGSVRLLQSESRENLRTRIAAPRRPEPEAICPNYFRTSAVGGGVLVAQVMAKGVHISSPDVMEPRPREAPPLLRVAEHGGPGPSRTVTSLSELRILSPMRLPVPPRGPGGKLCNVARRVKTAR